MEKNPEMFYLEKCRKSRVRKQTSKPSPGTSTPVTAQTLPGQVAGLSARRRAPLPPSTCNWSRQGLPLQSCNSRIVRISKQEILVK